MVFGAKNCTVENFNFKTYRPVPLKNIFKRSKRTYTNLIVFDKRCQVFDNIRMIQLLKKK